MVVGGLVLKVGVVVLVREEGAADKGFVILLKGSRLKKTFCGESRRVLRFSPIASFSIFVSFMRNRFACFF